MRRVARRRSWSGPQDIVSASFLPSLGGRSLWRIQRH
jgi:hypothetical protein